MYTTLGHLKQRFPELTFGDYRELYLTTGQFAFARCLDGRAVVTALNNADNGAHMEINCKWRSSSLPIQLHTHYTSGVAELPATGIEPVEVEVYRFPFS